MVISYRTLVSRAYYSMRVMASAICVVRLVSCWAVRLVASCCFLLTACHPASSTVAGGLHFSLLTADRTGIDFSNKIAENDSMNFFTNEYMYIGSGVGVGDFNNDGLPDLFFCASQTSSRLYLNKGNFKFDDITVPAHVGTDGWCTGVSVIDINNDGLLDIYVCVSGSHDPERRKNLLFVNQGNDKNGTPVFREEAADYGLADTGFSTQAVFFDYDRDGRLDMYLLNHRLYNPRPNDIVPKDTSGNAPAADRLYHNEGIPSGKDHPVFRDVSAQAGIKEDGYGLGVVVSDFNKDGWPDIYVANDYISNDLLWQNNGDGTFTNVIADGIKHQSYNSMGVDAADINNDGLPDLAVLDMSPYTNQRKKMMFAGATPERFDMERRMGYQPEYSRNMLQLNNGQRKGSHSPIPFFSEIGQFAGISETDWSWSVLMADLDNDGRKDLYITNGLDKDLTNSDFLFFWQSFYSHDYQFSGPKNDGPVISKEKVRVLQKELDKYGSIKINNFLFRNDGDLHFSDRTGEAGIATPSISQGAVYVDLDNDGALDLVVNNMNQEAFVWKNDCRGGDSGNLANFLTVRLLGDKGNGDGICTKLSLYTGRTVQYLEQYPVHGYASSVDNRCHFGMGKARSADSLVVEWPDSKVQVLRGIKANQFLLVRYQDAALPAPTSSANPGPLFTSEPLLSFSHHEISFNDFGYQRLLSQKYSQLGPALATGDVNGDGLEDVFVGGGSHQSGKLFIQQKNGRFIPKDLITGDKFEEDIGAVFFDADGDEDLDLLVTGGSTEYGLNNSYDQPRLYLNDGHGNFTLSEHAFPPGVHTVSQAVAITDLDGDGQPDLFIGGRVLPGKYPASPRSYLLHNDKGVFTDITEEICPSLAKAGMITAAIWTDLDNDGKQDLVICGDWMPVRFFRNRNGRLEEITEGTGLKNMNGLWRSIQAVDLDHDGDMDLVVGNIGLNNKYHVSAEQPMMLYTKDFDGNGFTDPVTAYYIRDNDGGYKLFPETGRNQLGLQLPLIKKKFLLFADYAALTMEQLLDELGRNDLVTLRCDNMASVWLENLGNGKFSMHPLPGAAQYAPVNAIITKDFYKDGNIDLLLAGNEYQMAVSNGRYDASYGLFLKGNGKGSFTEIGPVNSGFLLDGDVKNLRSVRNGKNENLIIAGLNDDSVRCFKWNK